MKYSIYYEDHLFGKTRHHLVFWTIFIAYEVAVSYSYSHGFSPFLNYFTAYALNISVFYVNSYFFFVYLTWKKQTFLYATLIVALEILAYLLLKYLITLGYIVLGFYEGDELSDIESFIRNSTWRAVYFIGLSAALGYSMLAETLKKRTIKLELEALTNEKEKLKGDLTLLRAQINPHFVFNSLGLVHNKVSKYSEESAQIVILLSEMMRYAMEEPDADGKVPAEEEFQYIRNYIDINRHRYDARIYVDFTVSGSFTGERIPPLLLLTLVENAFKYGYTNDEKKPMIIGVSNDSDSIVFTIFNYKKPNIKGKGLGIINLSQRLEKMYGKNFTYNIDETTETYMVTLILKK